MNFFIKEEKVAIKYSLRYREFSIDLRGSNGGQIINFCPWCGFELPKSLRSDWFDILENKYSIEDPIEQKDQIPEKFLTDKWWRTR